MPLAEIESVAGAYTWGLWHMEAADELLNPLTLADAPPPQLTHPVKLQEHRAGRLLVAALMESLALPYAGLSKDEHGKPFLIGHSLSISLSHSAPYVAALITHQPHAGIDLEQPNPKLLRIAPRIHSARELADAGSDIVKHCVYWCAKEALIKVHGKKGLILAEDLAIEPFSMQQEGFIIGSIIERPVTTRHQLKYRITPEFVVVFNTQPV